MVYIVLNPVLTFHVQFALSTVTKKEKSSAGSVISYKPAWDLWVISEFTTTYSLEIKKREGLGTRLFYNKGRLHYSDN